jgi:hypothetical protein
MAPDFVVDSNFTSFDVANDIYYRTEQMLRSLGWLALEGEPAGNVGTSMGDP